MSVLTLFVCAGVELVGPSKRVLLGVGIVVFWCLGMVVVMHCVCVGVELVGPSKRVLLGVGIVVFWCLGMVVLTPFAYLIRYWRSLQMAVSAVPVFFLSYYWSV